MALTFSRKLGTRSMTHRGNDSTLNNLRKAPAVRPDSSKFPVVSSWMDDPTERDGLQLKHGVGVIPRTLSSTLIEQRSS